MEDRATRYADLIKFFGFVLNQYRLYSEKHPAAQLAVRNFHARLDLIFGSESEITLGVVGGQLIVNGLPIDNKRLGVGEFVREAQRLHLDSLIFEKGAGEEEISSFFKVLAVPPKTVAERGGLEKLFEEAHLQHIRLGAARYKMVKEEEEVVSKSETTVSSEAAGSEEVAPGQVRRIERMEELVEHCLKESGEETDLDVERLAYEVEKKPETVARQMVQQAESLEGLKRLVKQIAHFLQERLAQPFIVEGKDFSQQVSRLAKEFRRVLETPEVPADFGQAVQELVGVLEDCADAVKLELMIKSFRDGGGDGKSLSRMAAKFLRSKEVRERLFEPLKARLAAMGVTNEELDAAVAETADRRASRRPRQADDSSREIEELRQLRDHFEEELARRVEEATAVLEREKRQALDEKERVETIIRNLGEGLVVVDVDGKIQLMNPAAEKLLGMNQERGKGVPLPQVLKDEHLMALAKGPLRDEGDRVTKEIELKSVNDETRRILQASTAVIENEQGKTVGMVSVLSDITQQKMLDEAKSKFVAHVSHELRTPLVAIDESLAILLREEAGEISLEQGKFLDIARRNIGRLSRLVNDLLDVAKLEAGKLDLHPITFQVNDMVHHVVETVRSWASEKHLSIEEKYPEVNHAMEADADRLIQVVTNLLGNAIKFTPENGKILVEVNPNLQDPAISPEPCVAVSVEDSGIGIPKKDQQRIFEKFEQAGRFSPDGVSSTGLGLTIAREIVALHRGKIWVESEEGKGSRFTFAIPTRSKNQPKDAQSPA